jgi:hypothetical protein
MKLNWFSSNLIVLTALCGMLSTPSFAAVKKPWRCEVCCPPTGCNYGYYFQESVNYHVGMTTQQVHGTPITGTQIQSAATLLIEAKAQMDQNGQMALFTKSILAYASVWESSNPNFSYYYPLMVKLGYLGTEADLLKLATTTTQQQRIDFIEMVQKGGMDAIYTLLIQEEQALAKGQGGFYNGHWIPDGGEQCQTAAATAAFFGMVAAGAAVVAAGGVVPAVGIAAVAGFVSAVFTLDYVMMGC